MQSLQTVQNKLLVEVLPTCNRAVLQATTLSDVEDAFKLLIKQVIDLGFPNVVLNYRDNSNP